MKIIGIVLMILGVVALVYGGLDYNRDRTVLQVGSMEIEASDGRGLPVSAIVGAIMLISGFALLVAGNRNRRGQRAGVDPARRVDGPLRGANTYEKRG